MASMSADASIEDIEEELAFQQVLVSSLDPDADDFEARLEELQNVEQDLESRLQARIRAARSRPPSRAGMSLNGDTVRPAIMIRRPDSNSSTDGERSTPQVGGKRPMPLTFGLDTDERRLKRATPDPSNAGTPTSSLDDFEWIDKPGPELVAKAKQRQLHAEAAYQRQRERELADAQLARSLDQQPRPQSSLASSSRPSVQTTIRHGGSYQKPPPPVKPATQESPPSHGALSISREQNPASVKGEPKGQQLPQRPRHSAGFVDLTVSDDEDLTEIAPSNFTPSNRAMQPTISGASTSLAQPQHKMPGSYPSMPMASPYPSMHKGPIMTPNDSRYVYADPRAKAASLAHESALGASRIAASAFRRQADELRELIYGTAKYRTHGSNHTGNDGTPGQSGLGSGALGALGALGTPDAPGAPGADPVNAYAGFEDLYKDRYDAIADFDPAKTKEEINALLENIRPDEDLPAHLRVPTPEAMNITLKKYQESGLTWLTQCEEGSNQGGILADDMGLGKTIQMLSLIVSRKSEDPRCKTTLVVAPVALMRQWKQEIETKVKTGRHALTVYTQHGQSKKTDFKDLRVYDVVLTTYGGLGAELKKMESFRLRQVNDPDARPYPREKCVLIGPDSKWYRVILDEAQCIKNRSTQTAKAAYMLNAKYRFAMTGTPMMNNIDELQSLIKFLGIRPYSEWQKFRLDFSALRSSSASDVGRERSMRKFQALCKAIMLRRTKSSKFEGEPILVLPERTTEIDNPQFDEHEQSFYDSLEKQIQVKFNKYVKEGTVGKSYSAILVLLLRLRQACCHPHLIKDYAESTTTDVTAETLIKLANDLAPQVVDRIREKNGAFDCAVCYDASLNPYIFIPCGHDSCADCFAKLTDPSNAIAQGNEGGGAQAKCPNCRAPIDAKRFTDFNTFKKVHQPELLTQEERETAGQAEGESEDDDDDKDDDDDAGSESESEDDEIDDKDPTLGGFIVDHDAKIVKEDSENESETDDFTRIKYDGERHSKPALAKDKGVFSTDVGKPKNKKSKKHKGKKKDKKAKETLTLAELRKLGSRNVTARKKYLRRLREDWVSSAKIEKTLEILKEIMDRGDGEKVLVFSQWTSLLDLLEVPIDAAGYPYQRYDGSMSAKQRGDVVDDFRDHRKGIRIMLCSLKAANAGLNLNMASQVIILDPFWNPYIEEQAIDRAHRLGQERPVKVHRLLVEGTVEDRIIALQETKRKLISEALDEKAGQSIARLGVQELAYLFGVTADPRQAIRYTPAGNR